MSGGADVTGGPAAAYLGPGLALGGPLPANASSGGDGRLAGVFINGRELHPLDVAGLRRYGQVYAGRYWWDRFGNVGLEGGPMRFNFYTVVQASSSGGSTYKPGIAPRREHLCRQGLRRSPRQVALERREQQLLLLRWLLSERRVPTALAAPN